MGAMDALKRRFEGHEPGLLGAKACYAVLCPLVETPEGLSLLYEVRAASLHRQPGEVCFPGGKMEPGESVLDCALRETEEELAIPRREITVLGTPDFICNQGGFLLRPVLGLVSPAGAAAMRPSPAEVDQTFTIPLAWLAHTPPEVFGYGLTPAVPEGFPYEKLGISPAYRWNRGQVELPVWQYQGHTLWGMTARITRDLVHTPGLI